MKIFSLIVLIFMVVCASQSIQKTIKQFRQNHTQRSLRIVIFSVGIWSLGIAAEVMWVLKINN